MTVDLSDHYAFPHENDANKDYNYVRRGMTLRDYFAAAALQADPHILRVSADRPEETLDRATARRAYALADAMLNIRSEK